jgi:hypothetical protein
VQDSGNSGPVQWRSGTQRNRERMQRRNRGIRVAARSWVQPQDFSSETESSAARGTVLWTGVGKMKHLSTKQLWVQGAIKIYEIDVVKIPRGINSADLLTHGCTTADFNNHLERLFLKRPRPSSPRRRRKCLISPAEESQRETGQIPSTGRCRHTHQGPCRR